MNKQSRIDVYTDTILQIESGAVESNSISTKHSFSEIKKVPATNEFIVQNMDSVSALERYSRYGKVCMLNMASYKRPGGGVRNGAATQEECLFRCSNLFETVNKKHYPLQDDQCIYTRDAVFFKNARYHTIDPITCDVVTIAAINLNKNSKYDKKNEKWVDGIVEKNSNYNWMTRHKMKLMLSLAKQNHVKVMILGAWGCGVFKNDPVDIANLFKEVFEDYEFEAVIFPIINDQNSVGDNYNVFKEVLCY